MRNTTFATCLAAVLAIAGTASAQSTDNDQGVGKKAGTFMVRARVIDVIPENTSSSTSVGGKVDATQQFAPEVDISYFFTDHIAAELIAASTRHEVRAVGTAAPTPGGDVDVGSAYVLPPTVTLQYHFNPHGRFSPYVGAGLNASWFYDTQPAKPVVTKFTLSNGMGEALQAGLDYNIKGHWFLNVDVKQIFLHTDAKLSTVLGAVKGKTDLDPTVVGVGLGYRF